MCNKRACLLPSVRLEPLLEEVRSLAFTNMTSSELKASKSAVFLTVVDEECHSSDSGFIEAAMDDDHSHGLGQGQQSNGKAAKIIQSPKSPQVAKTAFNKVLPHNINIVKHCRPLFGLVKHHVPARFQIKAKENKDQFLEELESIEPFSSLPPTMTSLCLATTPISGDSEPCSMPSSPFLLKGHGGMKSKRSLSVRDLSQDDGSKVTVDAAKNCREPNWHSRVWLQTGSNIQLLHLCHVCKLTCQKNYRNDISKHFVARRSEMRSSTEAKVNHSSAIIWYRYFAR